MALADQNVLKQQFTVAAPVVEAKDIATKEYVDNKIEGLIWDPVVAASTANIAGNYAAGVITASGNGAFPTIDGETLTGGERILLKDQTDPAENGIYTLSAVGDASNPWELTRATDADAASEFKPGKKVYVLPGQAANTNGDLTFKQTTATAIVVGTTGIEFVVDTPDMVISNTVNFTGDPGVYEYDITHAVNTKNVNVAVWRTDVTPNARAYFGEFVVNTTKIKLTCNPALQSTETYRVVITGLPDA